MHEKNLHKITSIFFLIFFSDSVKQNLSGFWEGFVEESMNNYGMNP